MTNDIVIPDEAMKYILFQRTEYLVSTGSALYKLFGRLAPDLMYRTAVAMESRLRSQAIKHAYSASRRAEYDSMKEWLPARCSSVLDIGSGMAGIDVFLFRHYGPGRAVEFYLLDKSATEGSITYGFKDRAEFYNSLEVAGELLRLNGISRENVHLVEATPDNDVPVPVGIDLVISLTSWGFHYPVGTYLDKVHAVMGKGGRLIMDVRKNTGGEDDVRKRFGNIRVIGEAEKRLKVLAIKDGDVV